jgi:hypothetical protein
MKYLNKYNKFSLNESSFEEDNRNELLPQLVDIMSEFVDDGHKVTLYSPVTERRLSINKYIEGSEDATEFNPVYKAGNKIKSKFKLIISNTSSTERFSKADDYVEFAKLVNDMSVVVGRIAQLDWELYDFDFISNGNRFSYLEYTFTKIDVMTDDKLPTIEEIKSEFEKLGLNAENIEYENDDPDTLCHVGAESYAYDGSIPDDIEGKLDRMIDRLGFDYYDHEVSGTDWLSVKFWVNPE